MGLRPIEDLATEMTNRYDANTLDEGVLDLQNGGKRKDSGKSQEEAIDPRPTFFGP